MPVGVGGWWCDPFPRPLIASKLLWRRARKSTTEIRLLVASERAALGRHGATKHSFVSSPHDPLDLAQ